MSSTSSISSTTNPYQAGNQSSYAQLAKSFQAIGTALQSGNVSGAQSALAAFQQNLPSNSQTSASQPFGKNSQANSDYQSLVSALQSGNASTAQQAYSSLQSDLKTTPATHKGGHHHHRHASSATEATSSTNATSPTTSVNGTPVTSVVGSSGSSNGSLLNVVG